MGNKYETISPLHQNYQALSKEIGEFFHGKSKPSEKNLCILNILRTKNCDVRMSRCQNGLQSVNCVFICVTQ